MKSLTDTEPSARLTCYLQLYKSLQFIPSNDLVSTDDLETTFDNAVSSDDVTVTCVIERVSDKAHDVEQVLVCHVTGDVDCISVK